MARDDPPDHPSYEVGYGKPPAAHRFQKGQSGNPVSGTTQARIYSTAAPNQAMNFQQISVTGSSFPHNNIMPSLVLNYCIAMQGVFPPRG